MGHTTDAVTETPGSTTQRIAIRQHVVRGDITTEEGGRDLGPGPHELFDAALASCKSLTAHWYAKKNGIPLESVSTHVERDDSQERAGKYLLKVRVEFHGPLDDQQKKRLAAAVAKCPIHRLMTQTKIEIETLEG